MDSKENANEFDAVIVGAGPAGSFSALKLAQKGIHTALIEEHAEIGKPVHCGECLSDFAVKNTGIELPSSAIAAKVKGVKIIFPQGKECVLTQSGNVLFKEKFEQLLAEKARKKGAEIYLNARINEMELENGKWNLAASNGTSLNSKLLVDASGVSQFASRKLNLNKPSETVIGYQYLVQDVCEPDYLEFYLWPKLAPQGYLWVIPKGNGNANIGLVTTQKNNAKKYCDEFLKMKGIDGSKIIKSFGGLIPHSGPLKKTFSDNLMLVGDAAGFTSPMFEGGTHLSLKSAELMAKTAEKAFNENGFSAKKLSEYEKVWKKEFPPYGKILKGKEKFYSYSEEELNIISRHLPYELKRITIANKIAYGMKLLATNPEIVFKGISSAFNSFSYSSAEFYGW